MNIQRIRYIFSLVFVIGFFVILVLVFIIESSDSHNMAKGENSYINELDMLLGVITAAVGQILNYWFSDKALEKSESAVPSLEGSASSSTVGTDTLPPLVAPTIVAEPLVEGSGINSGQPKPEEGVRSRLKALINHQFIFSLIFLSGFFMLLFSLFRMEASASASPETTDGNLIDILVILLGVLTAGIAQILNYWFNKDNRTEDSEAVKMMFKRISERPRVEKEKPAAVVEPETPKAQAPTIEVASSPPPPVAEVALAAPASSPKPKSTSSKSTPASKSKTAAKTTPAVTVQPTLTVVGKPGPLPLPILLKAGIARNTSMLESVAEFYQAFETKYEIHTNLRRAHFFAQLAHESAGFSAISENLNYGASGLLKVFPKYFTPALAAQYERKPEQIASRVYADRMGNGSEASGDGWKYRGRGFIQLTGKNNYAAFSKAVGIDFVSNPDLLLQPQYLLEAAGWFWNARKLNRHADEDNLLAVTKSINGGTNGLADRKQKLDALKAGFKINV